MTRDLVMLAKSCHLDSNMNLNLDSLKEKTSQEEFLDVKKSFGYNQDKALYKVPDNKSLSCWRYFEEYYYPKVIRESYPVYIQERAIDKGKQAFELIKMLKDKGFIKLGTVGNFIELMDELIKVL